MSPSLTGNVAADVGHLFDYAFMVNALEAGTLAAVMAAVVGWFMVLRRQSFAGHTLSVMAFPGAAAAALAGLPLGLGYYVSCVAAALVLGSRLPIGDAHESAAIGTVQATGLAVGFLCLALAKGVFGDLENVLFGSFLGIGRGQVWALAAVTCAVLAAFMVAGRQLLFASLDPAVAEAHGVPTGLLSVGYLLVLGAAVAATSQITGALLAFAVLVTPAATAATLTARPGLGLALTVAIALAVTWLGLGIAYYSPYPVGFWITSLAFAGFAAARLGRALRLRLRLRLRAAAG